ncbi:MAG: M20/M25/M40 family metallo-hydrolase, partial [bacterium]
MIGPEALRARLAPRRAEMIEELRRVVSIDSPTFSAAGEAPAVGTAPATGSAPAAGAVTAPGTTEVAASFGPRYAALGAEVETLPGSHGTGDHLLVRFRGSRAGGPKIFIIGHCDTVFPEGEAARRPFTVEGEVGRGPGVADMKGGLVTCLFAMEALMAEGFGDFGEIVILYDTDEERGNPSSRAHIEALGRDAAAALILEPARRDGSLVTSRRGSFYGEMRVRG